MGAVTTLRAVVVDDELLAREGLRVDLTQLGVDVVAVCADAYEARSAVMQHHPDLLLLDVEMPEVDAFGVLEGLEPEDVPPVVIFVTAHDQHAIRAFEARALDYLLKPVAPARLRDAIARAGQRVREAQALRDGALPSPAAEDREYLTQLVIRERDQVSIIPVSDVEWIEAETYYVRIHAARARPRLMRERMSVLEARLDPRHFFRTHRSAIVRLDLVRAIRHVSRYEHAVVLSTGATAPLSRDRRAQAEALLAQR